VAVHHDSLAAWFIPALVNFQRRTGRTLEIMASDHSATRDLMRAGQAVAALSSDPDPLPGCVARPLGRLDYVAVVAADHATGSGWKALPVLCFDRDDSPTFLSLASMGLSDVPRTYVPSVHDLHAALVLGAGLAVMPLPIVAKEIASGVLTQLVPGPTLSIGLFLHRWRLESPVLEVLEEEAVAAFR
jgi:LysR family transcriptional regulator (chromosome initiation inhibitor)